MTKVMAIIDGMTHFKRAPQWSVVLGDDGKWGYMKTSAADKLKVGNAVEFMEHKDGFKFYVRTF